jgi:hypothetical protein
VESWANEGRWRLVDKLTNQLGQNGNDAGLSLRQRQAMALLELGDREGYQQLCTSVSQSINPRMDPLILTRAVEIFLMSGESPHDWKLVTSWAEMALDPNRIPNQRAPTAEQLAYRTGLLGRVLYRAGKYPEAEKLLLTVTRQEGNSLDWLTLAMTQAKRQKPEAEKTWRKAQSVPLPRLADAFQRAAHARLLAEAKPLFDRKLMD